MGWWSGTIMGGDTPCDYEYDLQRAAKINTDDDERVSRATVRAAINKNLPKVFAAAKRLAKNEYCDDTGVAGQVLGVFIIENGARMTNEMRAFILKGCDDDQWANTTDEDIESSGYDTKRGKKDRDERKAFVTHFRKQIKRYKAKGSTRGIRVAHESLFEKFSKVVSKDKGLVNKNV